MLEQLAFTGKPGRVTDLARLLGTSKNRIHRHLQTLVDMGYVVRDADTQRYSRRHPAWCSSAARSRTNTICLSVSRPIMQRLRDRLGLTVVLSKVVAHQLYAIERIYGTSDVTVGVVIGSPLGLHSSAQGKIVLAFGDAGSLEVRRQVAARSTHRQHHRGPGAGCDARSRTYASRAGPVRRARP